MVLGYTLVGNGQSKVIVSHDWLSDCSGYESMMPYLDTDQFTFAFADLRGYGKSRKIAGVCTVEEASDDLFALAENLNFGSFHFIGHSMSAMIGQFMASLHPERIKSLALITPIAASGSPIPEVMLSFIQDATRSNDFLAEQMVNFMSGNRLTPTFLKYKVSCWRKTSEMEARLAYLSMFSETNFSNRMRGIETPMLVLLGAHDAEANSLEMMKKTILTWCPKAEVSVIENAGHYPTQETPVYLATLIDVFQKKHD
jgi:pimeloyl-ACP methyl ester carboxylesterase